MEKQSVDAWKGFKGDNWKNNIEVEDFIVNNYKEYRGDDSFLCGISKKTKKVWDKCEKLLAKEAKVGLLDVETDAVSGINTFKPGYIDRPNEVIFGLQTDKPLKRIVNLYGGTRMAEKALAAYGKHLNPEIEKHFCEYRKTHNDGVFDVYTPEIRKARKAGLITGLPDAYGRGRIIGDYRRVALYGIDFLIEEKKKDWSKIDVSREENIRLKEEVAEQVKALRQIKEVAQSYGLDISRPAQNAQEAVQ